jgi:Cu/Ag efflux protein CusF
MPDGATQILLFANQIPQAWPTPYVFTKPVALPKGTELSVIAHFTGDSAPRGGIATTLSTYAGVPLASDQPPPAHPATQRFKLRGIVKSVDAANGRLVVEQGDIPGFMGAMTMSYGVAKQEDLGKVAAGDQIESDVVSSDTGTYLENIAVAQRAK